ncbi:MAG: hypothetical protein AAGA75_00315 [Cyanobacteria bacterium P01_E01_bin.6]
MRVYDPSKPLFSLHIPKTGGSSLEYALSKWFNKTTFPNLNDHPRLASLLTFKGIDLKLQQVLGCGLYLHYKNHRKVAKKRIVSLDRTYGFIRRVKQPECVHGHFQPYISNENVFDHYPDACQFIMTLRDPLEMHISLFHYMRKMILSGNLYWEGELQNDFEFPNIDEWLLNRDFYLLKLLPWEVSSRNFKEIINKNFIHICILEKYQKSIDILASKLGFQSIEIPISNVTERDNRPSQKSIITFKQRHELEYEIYEYAYQLN